MQSGGIVSGSVRNAAVALVVAVVQTASPALALCEWHSEAVELLHLVAFSMPEVATSLCVPPTANASPAVSLVLLTAALGHRRAPLSAGLCRRLCQLAATAVAVGGGPDAERTVLVPVLRMLQGLPSKERLRSLLLWCDQVLLERPDALAGDSDAAVRFRAAWQLVAALPMWAATSDDDAGLYLPDATSPPRSDAGVRLWRECEPLASDPALWRAWLLAWPAAVVDLMELEHAAQPRLVALKQGEATTAATPAVELAPMALDLLRRLLMLAVVPAPSPGSPPAASATVALAEVASSTAVRALASVPPAMLHALDPSAWMVVVQHLQFD